MVAVGGMDTNYFATCWKEYVSKDKDIDLVIWEFSLNDVDTEQNGKTVERFIRSIMKHPSNPAIIFAQFFRRTQFPGSVNLANFKECFRDTEHMKMVRSIAKYYKMSLANLLKEVCKYQLIHSNMLRVDEMFIHHHPAHLGHAQMAYIIISYLKRVMTDYFSENLHSQRTIFSPDIPRPIYAQSDFILPVCWNAVFPHYKKPSRHNLFDLKVFKKSGFVKRSETPWLRAKEIRYDLRGGWQTNQSGSMIEIIIPVNKTDSRNSRGLRIVLHFVSDVTRIKFTVLSGSNKTISIPWTVPIPNTTMHYLYLGQVNYGEKSLRIETYEGFFQLAAIIVD